MYSVFFLQRIVTSDCPPFLSLFSTFSSHSLSLNHPSAPSSNPSTSSPPPSTDNIWGDYGPNGMLVENKHQVSEPAADTSQDIYMPYVANDITTFFTLLVGIYFPSVTGTFTWTSTCQGSVARVHNSGS